MKNLKANNERRADGVYFVRSASDQTARDEHLLYLLVSDGKILRTALQDVPQGFRNMGKNYLQNPLRTFYISLSLSSDFIQSA